MKKFIIKYEIWIFLILCPIVGALFVHARYEGFVSPSIYNTGRFCVLLFLLIGLLKFTKGNLGIKNLFKPMINWKIHPKWYLLSLVFPLAIVIITLLLKSIYFNVNYDTFVSFKSTTLRGYIALLVWAFLGEVVWVSYAIRELSKITNSFYAGQIVAIFWALWFIPLILLGEGIFPKIPILSAFIFIMGLAGMCSFIYNKTKSGLCVLLLQFMVNLTLLTFPITPTNGGALTYTLYGIIYFLVMLGIVGLNYYRTNKAELRSSSN